MQKKGLIFMWFINDFCVRVYKKYSTERITFFNSLKFNWSNYHSDNDCRILISIQSLDWYYVLSEKAWLKWFQELSSLILTRIKLVLLSQKYVISLVKPTGNRYIKPRWRTGSSLTSAQRHASKIIDKFRHIDWDLWEVP